MSLRKEEVPRQMGLFDLKIAQTLVSWEWEEGWPHRLQKTLLAKEFVNHYSPFLSGCPWFSCFRTQHEGGKTVWMHSLKLHYSRVKVLAAMAGFWWTRPKRTWKHPSDHIYRWRWAWALNKQNGLPEIAVFLSKGERAGWSYPAMQRVSVHCWCGFQHFPHTHMVFGAT